MSTFYGISAESASSFFSSNFSTTSSTSAASSNVGSMLSDYYAIQNGSYGKLVKAYYAKNNADTSKSDNGTNSATEKKTLTKAKNDAETVQQAASQLATTGSKSIFKQTDKTDDKGNITKEYDTEGIYKGVKSFVDSYNNLIDSTGESDTSSVLKKTLWLTNSTKTYENELKKVGITIGKNNKLAIDETAFRKANMTDVKAIFNGANSLAVKTFQKASDIYNLSNSVINTGSIYGSTANYQALSTGQLYDSMF